MTPIRRYAPPSPADGGRLPLLDATAPVAIYTQSHGRERGALRAVVSTNGRAALECRAPSKELTMRAEAQALVIEIEESLELLRRRL